MSGLDEISVAATLASYKARAEKAEAARDSAIERASLLEASEAALRARLAEAGDVVKPFAELGEAFCFASVVEVSLPHPNNPSSQIAPLPVEKLDRARAFLASFDAPRSKQPKVDLRDVFPDVVASLSGGENA